MFAGCYKAHLVEKDGYLLKVACWISALSVRLGLVVKPQDYPHSSRRCTTGLEKPPVFASSDEILNRLNADRDEACARYRREVVTTGVEFDLWKSVRSGVVIGSQAFLLKHYGLFRRRESSDSDLERTRPSLIEHFDSQESYSLEVRNHLIREAVLKHRLAQSPSNDSILSVTMFNKDGAIKTLTVPILEYLSVIDFSTVLPRLYGDEIHIYFGSIPINVKFNYSTCSFTVSEFLLPQLENAYFQAKELKRTVPVAGGGHVVEGIRCWEYIDDNLMVFVPSEGKLLLVDINGNIISSFITPQDLAYKYPITICGDSIYYSYCKKEGIYIFSAINLSDIMID